MVKVVFVVPVAARIPRRRRLPECRGRAGDLPGVAFVHRKARFVRFHAMRTATATTTRRRNHSRDRGGIVVASFQSCCCSCVGVFVYKSRILLLLLLLLLLLVSVMSVGSVIDSISIFSLEISSLFDGLCGVIRLFVSIVSIFGLSLLFLSVNGL